jgi:hypothetical protein
MAWSNCIVIETRFECSHVTEIGWAPLDQFLKFKTGGIYFPFYRNFNFTSYQYYLKETNIFNAIPSFIFIF